MEKAPNQDTELKKANKKFYLFVLIFAIVGVVNNYYGFIFYDEEGMWAFAHAGMKIGTKSMQFLDSYNEFKEMHSFVIYTISVIIMLIAGSFFVNYKTLTFVEVLFLVLASIVLGYVMLLIIGVLALLIMLTSVIINFLLSFFSILAAIYLLFNLSNIYKVIK